MHQYFVFLHEAGWLDDVVDIVLNQIVDFLADENVPQHASLEEMKMELVHDNPEGVANAMFRFILDDTLEKMGTASAGPVHWATAAYFWFKWKDDSVARMLAVRNHAPEFIHG